MCRLHMCNRAVAVAGEKPDKRKAPASSGGNEAVGEPLRWEFGSVLRAVFVAFGDRAQLDGVFADHRDDGEQQIL